MFQKKRTQSHMVWRIFTLKGRDIERKWGGGEN